MSCTPPDLWRVPIPYGDTLQKVATYTDDDDQPINLTGCTATLTATDKTGTQLFQLTTGSGITMGGTAGTITMFKQLGTAARGTYNLRLVLTSAGGIIKTLLKGELIIE